MFVFKYSVLPGITVLEATGSFPLYEELKRKKKKKKSQMTINKKILSSLLA